MVAVLGGRADQKARLVTRLTLSNTTGFTVKERGVRIVQKMAIVLGVSPIRHTDYSYTGKIQISDGTPETLMLHATPAPAFMA